MFSTFNHRLHMAIPTIALIIFFIGILARVIHHVVVNFNKPTAEEKGQVSETPKKSFSFLGSLMLIGMIIYPFFPSYFAAFDLHLPYGMKVVGLLLMLFSGAIIFWIQVLFGKNYNGTTLTRSDQHIFTSGPYKYVRHPMYTITILFILGLTLAMDNYLIGLLGLVSYCIPVLIIAKKEEEKLIQTYGKEYVAYMERTGRFLPKI